MLTCTIFAQKDNGASSVTIFLTSDGDIVIEDYSHHDKGREIIEHLAKLGVRAEIISESPCG